MGNNIRKCREARGYSQKYISLSLGVKQPSVCAWESGITMPSSKNLAKLSELLHVSVDYLLGNTDEENPVKVAEPPKEQGGLADQLTDKIHTLSTEQLIELRGYIAGRFGK